MKEQRKQKEIWHIKSQWFAKVIKILPEMDGNVSQISEEIHPISQDINLK